MGPMRKGELGVIDGVGKAMGALGVGRKGRTRLCSEVLRSLGGTVVSEEDG